MVASSDSSARSGTQSTAASGSRRDRAVAELSRRSSSASGFAAANTASVRASNGVSTVSRPPTQPAQPYAFNEYYYADGPSTVSALPSEAYMLDNIANDVIGNTKRPSLKKGRSTTTRQPQQQQVVESSGDELHSGKVSEYSSSRQNSTFSGGNSSSRRSANRQQQSQSQHAMVQQRNATASQRK